MHQKHLHSTSSRENFPFSMQVHAMAADFIKEKKTRRLATKAAIAMGVLILLVLGLNAGLTAAIVFLSKDVQVSNHGARRSHRAASTTPFPRCRTCHVTRAAPATPHPLRRTRRAARATPHPPRRTHRAVPAAPRPAPHGTCRIC